MMRPLSIAALSSLCLAAPSLAAQEPAPAWSVSAQGRLFRDLPADVRTSPRGSLTLELERARGDEHRLRFDLRLRSADGRSSRLEGVLGNGFYPSDAGRVVVLDAHESNRVPTRVTVLDLGGVQLGDWRVPELSDPELSPDGLQLAYRTAEGTEVVSLGSLERRAYPRLTRFALGPAGALLGISADDPRTLRAWDALGRESRVSLPFAPRQLAAGLGGGSVLALDARALFEVRLGGRGLRELYRAEAGSELRDLRVTPAGVLLGAHANQTGSSTGSLLQLGAGGVLAGPTTTLPMPPPVLGLPTPTESIPWPLSPTAAHAVGNTYGEFQEYGGSPYMHPGIDVLGFDGEPVYAVKGGVVKSILTTSGQYHWRIAIGEPGNGTTTGYLYAHVDQPTITVNVGDAVVAGQYIGDLVPWPVAGFTHCHFARIEDSGAQWSGSWLCTDNPQPEMVPQTDATSPLFEAALGADLFAFSANQTSNYLDPAALTGQVDIVARVSDTVGSTWRCSVQTIRYSIWPAGQPNQPLVDEKLAVRFDMALDTYQGGPIDPFLVDLLYREDATCDTDGDYSSRDFYHVVTNSDGDENYENSDLAQAWDTSALSDGNYVVEVRAWDAAGNSASASMLVTTANGNP